MLLWAKFVVLFGVLAFGRSAIAAEKPEISPPDAWVLAAPKPPAPMKSAAGAAIGGLIQDAQIRFDPQGFALYQVTEAKIQTAQGLQALSTISLSWSQSTDRLVVHRVHILRGDQVIDVLPKDGVFTIARREEKLDSEGRLDGILTAILKLDGLQVGDIIDLSYTIHRNDPLFKGRVDYIASVSDLIPVSYDRIRMTWPGSDSTRWRVAGGMPEPHVTNHDGLTDAEIVFDGVVPLIKPQGAPARFQRGREFSVSNYSDWAAVSAAMAPLFADAVKLQPNSPLKAEAAAIAAKTNDPELRAAAALMLVQDKIRYLAQTLGEGGYKPATADDTWTRRYGDCKAKTAMLLALLNEFGISAEPTLVSTILGDDLDTRLPSLAVFDHVLVHTVISGRDYWLDGTRAGDLSLAALTTPKFGYVLPLKSSGATLIRLRPDPFKQPQVSNIVHLDAAKGLTLPAAAHVETVFRGDAATVMRLAIANLAPDDLERALRTYWHDNYDFITMATSKAAFDRTTGEERLTMEGVAKLDWSSGYEADGDGVGWKFDIVRDAAAIHPDAPFALEYPYYVEHEETITLPDQGAGFSLSGDLVDRQVGGYALKRQASIEHGAFHMVTSSRALQPEISYAMAKADAAPVTALSKTALRIYPPANSKISNNELKAMMAQEPATASAYLDRGNALGNANRYREALHDYDHVVQLDPKSAVGMGNRALAHAWLGETKEALADADMAEQLDPREPSTYRARGLVAEKKADWPEAISNFTRSIDLAPNAFGFDHRARDYARIKDYTHALRDLDAELKRAPDFQWAHVLKAQIYIELKEPQKARAEMDLVKPAADKDDGLRKNRLDVLVLLGDRKTARAEADAALEAHKTAGNYLMRIDTRESDDLSGSEADATAAYAADPKNLMAVRYMIAYRLKAKDYLAAKSWTDKAVTLAPIDPYVRTARAKVYLKLGQPDAAHSDFAFVRQTAKADAGLLNDLCYEQATSDFDLNQALVDCDASLALNKSAATLDSRGFVLMRLGRNQEARKAFDYALALAPSLANSLYGRSLVERRLGDIASADQDKAVALAKVPTIVETFAGFGVTL